MPHEERMVQNNSNAPGYQTLVEEGGTAYIGVNHIYPPHNPPNSRILELQLGVVSAELERLSSDFSEEIDVKLEEIREFERKGLGQSARNQIQNLRNSKNWEIFTKPLQAKILRMLARYAVTLDRDPSTAKNLLESSVQLDCESDTTFLRTLIRFYTDGMESALAEINNITELSALNLKLALLLEMDRADEAIDIIKSIPENIQSNADTYRLHALALLTQGNVLAAQQKIQEAIAVSPEWETVREAEALIDYHKALSPAALQKGRFPISEPVHRAFIKHDDESLDRLRKAEATFEKLASGTEIADELRQYWRIWQLACCASNPNRKNEAKVFCKTLLEENPGNTKALSWAIYRNYEIDAELSRKTLAESLENSIDDINKIERITLLVWFYIDSSNSQTALSFLEENKEKFEQQDAIEYWLFWRVRALVGNKEFGVALQEIETLQAPKVRYLLKTLVLSEIAERSKNWQPVIEHLENCFEETQDGNYLYDCCHLKSSLQDWDYVVDRAEILIEKIGTPDALNLAVDCAYKARRPNQCVKILNDRQNLFPRSILPEGLRCLRIWCLAESGFVTEAVAEAEALVQESLTSNNILTLMDMQVRYGDLDGMLITARKLLEMNLVSETNLLQAARLVQLNNSRLARQLWDRAVVQQPLDPEIFREVIDIGFKLSLDKDDLKFRIFLYQAQILAVEGRGSWIAVSLKDIIAQQQKWLEQSRELSSKYDRGEFPLSVIADISRIPLISLFQTILSNNAATPNPHHQPSTMIRHGGRPVQEHPLTEEFKLYSTKWRLHLDISAFLLADYLNILELLEEHFRPLRISASFQPALLRQIQLLQSHQPSRLDLYQKSLGLVSKGILKELPRQIDTPIFNQDLVEKMGKYWVTLLEKAKVERGYIIEFLPLQRISNNDELQVVSLSDEDRERVIDCHSLLETLNHQKLLTDSQYKTALQSLKDRGYLPLTSSLLERNTSIFLMDGIIDILIETKIIDKICQYFRVFVNYTYLDKARLTIGIDEQRVKLTDKLSELIERVRDGLNRGIYETIKLPARRLEGEEAEINRGKHLDLLSISDLLSFEAQLKNDDNDDIDLIWIDDRCFNQFLHRDGIQIITIIEVLEALFAREALSQDDYYDKLLQLRKANARYIPISGTEITYWLKQAQIIDGFLKETEELAIIRQYIASCLLDNHRLQLPSISEDSINSSGEIYFPLRCLTATSDAIVAGWLDDSVSNEDAIVYADWVLGNLYTGTFGTRHLAPANHDRNNSNDWVAIDISGLYIRGFSLSRKTNINSLKQQSRRQHYFDWINSQFTERHLKANPEAVKSTAKTIHFFLAETINIEREGNLQELVIRHMYDSFIDDLPNVLRTEIESDQEFMNWLGIQIIQSVKINSISFLDVNFWKVAEIAINGRESTITALRPNRRFKIQPSVDKSSGDILEIRYLQLNAIPFAWLLFWKINFIVGLIFLRKFLKTTDNSIAERIKEPSFQLLSNDRATRENFLRSNSFWIDSDCQTLERVIREVISIEEPGDRIKKAYEWRDRSAAVFYKQLAIDLNEAHQFKISELVPTSMEGLIRYFRLETSITNSDDFHKHLNQAARLLIEEEGIEEALERLACLPVKLPSIFLKELSKLDPDCRQSLLRKLANSWKSPVCIFHLIDIALEFPCEEEIEIVKYLLGEIYGDAAIDRFNLFKAFLQLTNNELSFRDDIKEWSVPLRLAMTWAHTSKLQNILDEPSINIVRFVEILSNILKEQVNTTYIDWDSEFSHDVLNPCRFDQTILSVHGLAHLLQGKSLEVLNQAGVIECIRSLATVTVSEQQFPHPSLLQDPLLAGDSLKSIMGGARCQYLAPILETELIEYLEPAYLKSNVREAIQKITNDPIDANSWLIIQFIIRDLPLYEDLVDSFNQMIEGVDIVQIYQHDPKLGLSVLTTLSDISSANEHKQIENMLFSIVRLIADRELSEDDSEDTISQLIGAIFRICVIPKNSYETSLCMASMLIKVFDICPQLANSSIGMRLFHLIRELPTDQSHGFWKALLHVRALRNRQI